MKRLIGMVVLVSTLMTFAGCLIGYATIAVVNEYNLQQQENKCIAGWIQIGVERKYIHRNNGDCYYSKTLNKN